MTSDSEFSATDNAASEQADMACLLIGHIAPVKPSPSVQLAVTHRLQERLTKSMAQHSGLLTVRAKNGAWQTLKQGIRFKLLWCGHQGNSVLIDFASGAVLPEHRHNWLEEGIVLRGGLQMGDLELGVHDYHASPPGSRHGRIQSRQGALAYLRGTSLGDPSAVTRELLGGLLPFGKAQGKTVYARDDGWETLALGVSKKRLSSDSLQSSCLLRFEADAKMGVHAHTQPEECMLLSGELFLGDILLREGDYQLAPEGSVHGEAYSDTGALLFLRGAKD